MPRLPKIKNPLRLLRIYRAGTQLLDQLDQGRADWEQHKAAPASTAYTSPGWWTRVLTAARDLALAVGMPAEVQEVLMLKNWKTTLSGAAAVLAIVSKVIATGNSDWQVDGPAILAGIGLILAKDASGAPAGK